MKSRSKRSTRSSTSLRQRSIDEVFRTSKASNDGASGAKRAHVDATLRKVAIGTPTKPAQAPTDIVVFPDVTKASARAAKAGTRRQLTLAELSGVDSHARKPRQKAKGKSSSAKARRSASASASASNALLSHLRSRKNSSKTPSALAKVVDYEVVAPADTDDFPEPVATRKSLPRGAQTPPRTRASPKKSTRTPPKSAGKRKTPSKSTKSRSRLPTGEAGEGEQDESALTSDSDSGASEGEAGEEAGERTQPEGGHALSPKPRKSSAHTAKGSPKKKLKSTPASTELTQLDSPRGHIIEAKYVPSPLKAHPKRATRGTRSHSTSMTQTQEEEEEEGGEEPGARKQRPIRSRHTRLVRLGSGASARSRSPVGEGADSGSSLSDSDSDGAITFGARTPRRAVRARKNQMEGRERDVGSGESGESAVSETDESSSKKAQKDDFEGKQDHTAGTLPPEDNSDILFDGLSSEIVIPKDVLVSKQPDGNGGGTADLDDLDTQIDRQHAKNTAKSSSKTTQPESPANRVLSEHLGRRFSSPRRGAASNKRHPGWGGSPRVFSPVPAAKTKPGPSPPPSSSPLRSPLRSSRGARLVNSKGSPKQKRGATALQRGRGVFQDASSSQRDLFDPPTSGLSPSLPTTNEGEDDAKANDEGSTSTSSSLQHRSKSSPAKMGRRQQPVPATPPRHATARTSASPALVNTPVGASSQFQSPKAPPSARSRLGRSRAIGAKGTPPSNQSFSPSPSRGRERMARARQMMSGEHRSDLNRALTASSPSRLSSMRELGSDAALGPARAERRRQMIEGLQAAQKGQIRLFLPSSYNLIISKFKAMESFIALNLSRKKSTVSYDEVKTSVEGTTRREFTHNDLGVIVSVFPEGYELKNVLRTKKAVKWKKETVLAVIAKNCGIEKRSGEHAVVVLAKDQAMSTKMNFMSRDTTFSRRHLFRERMEHRVLEEHQSWLRRSNKGDHNPYVTNMWHPDFPLEKTALPESVKMPEVPKSAPFTRRYVSSRSSSVDVLKRARAHALKVAAPRPASKSVVAPKKPAASASSSSGSTANSSSSSPAIPNTANKSAAGTRSPRKKKRNDGDISCLDPAILKVLKANSAAQKELKDISHYNFRIRHLKEMWTFVRLVSGIMKQKHKTAFSYPELKALCRKRARGITSEATTTTRFNMLFELAGDWCKLIQPGPNSTLRNPIFKITARPGYNINLIRLTINNAIKETEIERAEAML